MKSSELRFDRSLVRAATAPPEQRGLNRDDVRLLVSTPRGNVHARFRDLARFLDPGDLLVVNDSATLPASLCASSQAGRHLINVSTRYGPRLWLVEPRWDVDRPGPLPLAPGDRAEVCGGKITFLAPYPGTDRLWFVEGDLAGAMTRCGQPIRYGYLDGAPPLSAYQTLFARAPGSAEMPSAARPFTPRVLRSVLDRGVRLAWVRVHTGLSSLDVKTEEVEGHPIPPEPFVVPEETAGLVWATRQAGQRVVAVGTTVVRALETAWRGADTRGVKGFTRLVVTPERGVRAVDGLLTGFHDSGTSHLAMLFALAGRRLVLDAYTKAAAAGYLWHEFGDSHLLLPRP